MDNTTDNVDINEDGKIDKREYLIYEKRAWHRRTMAWVSLIAAIVSGFCLMFFVPESRLKMMDGLLELYWIGLLGISGTYVGVSTWISKK